VACWVEFHHWAHEALPKLVHCRCSLVVSLPKAAAGFHVGSRSSSPQRIPASLELGAFGAVCWNPSMGAFSLRAGPSCSATSLRQRRAAPGFPCSGSSFRWLGGVPALAAGLHHGTPPMIFNELAELHGWLSRSSSTAGAASS